MSRRHLLCVLTMCGSVISPSVRALTVSQWVSCIQTANSYCSLDPASYTGSDLAAVATLPITIANGVTAVGGGTNEYSTKIQRPSGNTNSMFYIASGSTVTLENLALDGNRDSFSSGCPAANAGPIDVVSDGTLKVDSATFWKASKASIYMHNGTLSYVSVYYARSTGIWIYNGGSSSSVSNGYFQYNGTAALRLSGSGGTDVSSTTFDTNRYEMPDGVGGGQLYIDGSYNTVELNTINGENYSLGPTSTISPYYCTPPSTTQGVAGIEVEPSTSSNSLRANEILKNTGDGITVHGVSSITISGYYPSYSSNPRYIHDNTGSPNGYYSNGILFTGGDSSGVLLDGILSRLNDGWAVDLTSGTTGTGFTNSNCLGSNFEASPYWTPTSNSLTPPGDSPSTGTCP